jgi:hypothetical protein
MGQRETGTEFYTSTIVVGEIGATTGVVIKSEERNKMPGVAKKGGGKRRAANSVGDAKNTSKLSGRKRVQTTGTCSAGVASKDNENNRNNRSCNEPLERLGGDSEDDDNDEDLVLTTVTNGVRKPVMDTVGINTMHGMSVSTKPSVSDEVSMLRDSSNSSVKASWESKMEKIVELRMKEMEANWKNQRANVASVVSAPVNDDFLRENLRKFVAERVFPKFKFIFKNTTLGQVVEMALTNGFITKPNNWTVSKMQQYYSQVVRHGLDGCWANAQSVARKKYIGRQVQLDVGHCRAIRNLLTTFYSTYLL